MMLSALSLINLQIYYIVCLSGVRHNMTGVTVKTTQNYIGDG